MSCRVANRRGTRPKPPKDEADSAALTELLADPVMVKRARKSRASNRQKKPRKCA